MNELFLKSWKGLALRGAVSLAFGILAALWPGMTLMWLLVMFAAYALAGGAVSIVTALQNRKSGSEWWLLLLLGLMGLAAGTIAIVNPGLTAVMLVLVIGATAFGTGILDIAMGIRLRKVIRGEAFLILNGIISVVFGLSIFFFPGAGALALIWLISMYAVVSGFLLLMLAWRARNWSRDEAPSHEHGVPHGGS